jgi:hypothetical protein
MIRKNVLIIGIWYWACRKAHLIFQDGDLFRCVDMCGNDFTICCIGDMPCTLNALCARLGREYRRILIGAESITSMNCVIYIRNTMLMHATMIFLQQETDVACLRVLMTSYKSPHETLSCVKADSHTHTHISCRAHAVLLPCGAAKGLECDFPI